MAHRISIIEECKQEIYAGLEITREEALALVDAPLAELSAVRICAETGLTCVQS